MEIELLLYSFKSRREGDKGDSIWVKHNTLLQTNIPIWALLTILIYRISIVKMNV